MLKRCGIRTVLAAAVLSGLVLTGCDDETQVGAAALVGDDRISVGSIQDTLENVLDKEGDQAKAQLVAGEQLDDVTLQILNQRISHELVEEAATRYGLTVEEAVVSRLVDERGGADTAAQGTIFDADGVRERARDELLMVELGRQLLPRLTVSVDYTTAATREDAERRVEELTAAGPEGAQALIDRDVKAGGAAALDQRIVALDNPPFAAAPVFGTAVGSVVAFPADDPNGSWLVMVVERRAEDRPVTDTDRRTLAALDPALLQAVGLRQLAFVADEVGIKISPRYGVWDPVSVSAVRGDVDRVGFTGELRKSSTT